MCGIAGFYSFGNSDFVSREELQKMTDSLKHRGPDAGGMYYTNKVGLGHRRLSIIDLSMDANQPMESRCMRYICVFNGEIYNYSKIANELGINFKTGSDTEVVVEAFAEWGVTFVNKLNGMFAIAIYDKQENNLYIFRDRIGEKPLYYYWDGVNFAFGSELKALLKIDYIKSNRKLNKQAINEFLHLGYIPEPNSIYENIRKFLSGNFAIVSSKGFRFESYWDVEGKVKEGIVTNEKDAKKKFKDLIEDSVAMRLVGDVELGSFLSGGIDSSLVTAVASKISTKKLNTFSIGFSDSKHNEAEYAKKIAEYLGTNHHEHYLTSDEAIDVIDTMLDYYDEPFGDSSAIPTMILSKFVKNNASMALSGDGGDELFLGYGAYTWAKRLSRFPLNNFKSLFRNVLKNVPNARLNRAAYHFNYLNKKSIKSNIFSQEQYLFSNREINKLLCPDYNDELSLDLDYSEFVRKLTSQEAQAVFDIKYYLKDDLLVKVDRASMKHALEVRVPILDYRIVEFALNLDHNLKIYDNSAKYLMKQVLYDYIPKKFFDRPKWGFSVPLANWLNNEMSFLIADYLNESVVEQFGVVDYNEVRKLKKAFFGGKIFLYNRLWLLIVLHKFLIKNEAI